MHSTLLACASNDRLHGSRSVMPYILDHECEPPTNSNSNLTPTVISVCDFQSCQSHQLS